MDETPISRGFKSKRGQQNFANGASSLTNLPSNALTSACTRHFRVRLGRSAAACR
jgi:hypothetical protein